MAVNIIRLSKVDGLDRRVGKLKLKELVRCQGEDLGRWRWQYELNPYSPGQELPAWVAVSDDEAAGHLGSIPVKLKVNSRTIDAAWAVDFATRQTHRRKGIGRLLVEEALKEYGLLLTVGQTDASFNLFVKMGWKFLGEVPYYIRILDLKFLAKGRIKNPLISNLIFFLPNLLVKALARTGIRKEHADIKISRIDTFDEEADLFWRRIGAGYRIAVPRDSAYLNWKYVHQPGMDYVKLRAVRGNEVCGYLIIRVIRDASGTSSGLITDIVAHPDDKRAMAALISAALKHFVGTGCSLARCYVTSQGVRDALASCGFMRHGVKMRLLVSNYPDGCHEMENIGNWHLTAGDCDIDRPS